MKKQPGSNWQKQLLFTAMAIAFLLAVNSLAASAQTRKYKPGDRVECDVQMSTWQKGTVVPYLPNDLDKDSGRWYRVKLDMDTIPNMTRECLTATHLRPLVENEDSQNDSDTSETDETKKNNDTNNKTPSKNKTAKYKPGDRVECDKSQIGIWEKGTVVHYLPNDLDKESGSYYRVKLDGYKLYLEGHECSTNFIRPLNEAALKASGKYKVGDRIEAKTWSGSWIPAKIIAVEGAFYKVTFDNRDKSHDEIMDEERIRRASNTAKEAGTPIQQNDARNTNPKTGATPRSLPGTAWKIDFGKGVTGTIFLFCKGGKRWEIVPARAGSIGAVGKSWTVSGSTLTTVNADDGMVQKWKMSWEGDVLVLNDGKQTLRLHYNGETQCK